MTPVKLLFNSRKTLQSPVGRAVTIVFAVILVVVLISDAVKTYQVFNLYGAREGSLFWLVLQLKIISSVVAVFCLLLSYWLWSWSALVWSFLVSLIAILGFKMGLNPEFVTRWDVFLPWGVLAVTFIFETPFRVSLQRAA